jgi:hypothetical protein
MSRTSGSNRTTATTFRVFGSVVAVRGTVLRIVERHGVQKRRFVQGKDQILLESVLRWEASGVLIALTGVTTLSLSLNLLSYCASNPAIIVGRKNARA